MQNLRVIDGSEKEKEFILFSLKEKVYAIESKSILEISKLVTLENPERLPNHVVGVLEYNSFFISVVDLKSVLGFDAEKYTIDNQILVVTTGENILGLVIDKVIDIKKIPNEKIQATPYSNEFSFSAGLCNINEENIVILNLYSIENIVKDSLKSENREKLTDNLFPDDPQSIEILKIRNTQLLEKLHTEQLSLYDDNEQSVTFKIEDETYCIDIAHIKSFYKLKSVQNITKVPCTPSFVIGLLNVKGDFVTVIDLRDYLNFGKTNIYESSIVIILEAGDYKLGIMADGIGARMDISDELEKSRSAMHFENKPEIINFVRDDNVYSILLVNEILKSEKLHI